MRLAELGAMALLGVVLTLTAPVRAAHGQTPAATPAASQAPEPNTISGPVDINSATAAELGKVPFIGRKRAAAIIAGRPWHGPADLVTKRIMPRKVYDRIKDQLFVK